MLFLFYFLKSFKVNRILKSEISLLKIKLSSFSKLAQFSLFSVRFHPLQRIEGVYFGANTLVSYLKIGTALGSGS